MKFTNVNIITINLAPFVPAANNYLVAACITD
jgi:hypothetical protein